MAKLHTLRLGRNHITDISPVKELKDLAHLAFGHNDVEDISALYDSEPNLLHVLCMNNNKIRNIGPVENMPELQWLEVAGNPLDEESIRILDNLGDHVTHLER